MLDISQSSLYYNVLKALLNHRDLHLYLSTLLQMYVTVLLPELKEPRGMLDNKTLEEKQKKMQEDMKTFYE